MTHILFGQSYYLKFDPKLYEAMKPYPPLGTLYAASYLRERGYRVALFDAMLAESEQDWALMLDEEQPMYAVIYEDNFNYLSKMCLDRMQQAAFTMIEMAKARNCTVIVSGSDASDHTKEYLAHGADYVLIGEGELTLGELMDHLTGRVDTPLSEIAGVASKDHPNPHFRPVIKDLDALPMPAWDLVDVPRYRSIWRQRHGYYSMNVATTRGCPYHCNWCAKPIWGQRYNTHTPDRVVAEIKHLMNTYQPDHIWFVDDIMGLKPGWIERFAELTEKENLQLPFKCLSRVDLLLRGNTINALKRAGCQIVWVGAESGSQKILDAMEKGTKVEQIREASQRLHDEGVQVGFFLQFGYPGETREDIERTLQLVRDCNPDDIGISVSYPLAGTTFYERVKDQLGMKHNWLNSSDLAMLYHGPFTTDFYRQLHKVVHKEFRARKVRDELKRNPFTLHSQRVRDVIAMAFHIMTLPFARRQLDRLAQQPHQGFDQLTPGMDYAKAATPTLQDEDIVVSN